MKIALHKALLTWNKSEDGSPIVDYSSNNKGNNKDKKSRKGKHAETIDTKLSKEFLKEIEGLDFDIMLEIKDKEKSALKGLEVFKDLGTIFATSLLNQID